MNLNYNKEYNKAIRAWLLKNYNYAKLLSEQKLISRVCPVCGSQQNHFFANNGSLNYVQCNECSLAFMNPAPAGDSINEGFQGDDAIVMEYFNIMMKYKTALPEKPDPLIDNKLSDIYRIKSSGSLLDVGCSVGDFLHKAKYFYDVEGVEVNPFTAAVAEQFFTIHKNYLSELKLPADQYDIVTLHQILYGVPNPVGLLQDIYKVLKIAGKLYINTPNSDSFATEFYKGQVNHLYGYTTQQVFNRKSLERLAELTGFRLLTFRTEWLDIYTTDILEYMQNPQLFIHKRNCYVENYEEKIAAEEALHSRLNYSLGNRGNYLVAVLEKV
ncbi:SAM-dependent methyltransferase [Sporomusaceae bacterium BoRhaA]|uniref:class I SAM-dependent methyltransferase n=1 Tax=Pelorhabdus rhamnosifermentans TaxID=2772457 RepID=UPI001C063319|nr:class I SAM-dependent methyltransferase [Pelorhabdus rhamnosifermentans]MBU2699178.1 SAM-dependent methyltransferase [Pelorhabdus rhamnosifermentans]